MQSLCSTDSLCRVVALEGMSDLLLTSQYVQYVMRGCEEVMKGPKVLMLRTGWSELWRS